MMRFSDSNQRRARRVLAALMAGALVMVWVPYVAAGEVDDLAKQVDKALRDASRLMFAGKTAESSAKLDEAGELLEQMEAKDPNNIKLKILRPKYEKLRKDLARRMPQDAAAEASAGNSTNAQAAGGNADLPRNAREAMRNVKSIERSIEHAYRMIESSKTTELSKPVEEYYADIEKYVSDMKDALKKVRDEAKEKGVTSHPDIDEVQQYIDEAPARLDKVRAEMRAFMEEKAAKEAASAQKDTGGKVDVAQAQADWKELAPLSKEYQQTFLSQSAAKKKGARLQVEWNDWKKRFEPVRDRFRSRYGTSNPQVYEAFENVPAPEGVEMPATQAANIAYDIDIPACEARFAEWAANWGAEALRVSTHIPLENTEKLELKYVRAEDAVRYFKLAQQWGAAKDVSAQLAEAESAVAEALPLWKKALEKLEWPGHNPKFSGPGSPDALAAEALEFLKEHPDWTAPEYDDEHVPLAACVEGEAWNVWKRAPLTEEPTQYNLSMLVAFTGKADPDLLYVYHMVFYTAEAAGVQPGSPLRYANSKQYASFRMLRKNVPTGM